ncbi:MAG TPA: 6-pyruvoyl tetrahydrobiopterin synthase, partial [Hyphomonas sp.]|nr:6-pyruvoyl tetrahydrobiopterin synthase [Hyphomonas sp.]
MFAISKSVNFEAAHYMGGKPEGHPYRNVHGHSFVLEATV